MNLEEATPEHEGPTVLIDNKRLLCPCHGEHLRAQWPKGFAAVVIRILPAALEREGKGSLLEACGEGSAEEVPVERINEITAKRPLCYFVDRDVIREALLAAEILMVGKCHNCQRPAVGGPYSAMTPAGPADLWLCIKCALDAADRMHKAMPEGGVWPEEAP